MLSKLIGTEERNYRSYQELQITLSPDHCCCTAAAREKTERTAPIDVHTQKKEQKRSNGENREKLAVEQY